MGVVAVELGPLVMVQRVFDGEVVQAEFLFQFGEDLLGGRGDVDPQAHGLLGEPIGDLRERQLRLVDDAIAVKPGNDHARNASRAGAAGSLGTAFLAAVLDTDNDRGGGGMGAKSQEFGDYSFVVVSNRLPVDRVIDTDDDAAYWQQSPGGLVTALEPVMRANDGAWIGWAGVAGSHL